MAEHDRILGYFLDEAQEHLRTIEEALIVPTSLAEPARIKEVFRAAHSIKGGSAMLDLETVQQIGHHFEQAFKAIKDRSIPVDEKLQDYLLEGLEILRLSIQMVQYGQTPPDTMGQEPVFAKIAKRLVGGNWASSDAELSFTDPVIDQIFCSYVTQKLQQFVEVCQKPQSEAVTKQELQPICQKIGNLGERYEYLAWTNLLISCRLAVNNPLNSVSQLRDVIPHAVRQAQILVTSGKQHEITITPELEILLAPNAINSTKSFTNLAVGEFLELGENEIAWDDVVITAEEISDMHVNPTGVDFLFEPQMVATDNLAEFTEPEELEFMQLFDEELAFDGTWVQEEDVLVDMPDISTRLNADPSDSLWAEDINSRPLVTATELPIGMNLPEFDFEQPDFESDFSQPAFTPSAVQSDFEFRNHNLTISEDADGDSEMFVEDLSNTAISMPVVDHGPAVDWSGLLADIPDEVVMDYPDAPTDLAAVQPASTPEFEFTPGKELTNSLDNDLASLPFSLDDIEPFGELPAFNLPDYPATIDTNETSNPFWMPDVLPDEQIVPISSLPEIPPPIPEHLPPAVPDWPSPLQNLDVPAADPLVSKAIEKSHHPEFQPIDADYLKEMAVFDDLLTDTKTTDVDLNDLEQIIIAGNLEKQELDLEDIEDFSPASVNSKVSSELPINFDDFLTEANPPLNNSANTPMSPDFSTSPRTNAETLVPAPSIAMADNNHDRAALESDLGLEELDMLDLASSEDLAELDRGLDDVLSGWDMFDMANAEAAEADFANLFGGNDSWGETALPVATPIAKADNEAIAAPSSAIAPNAVDDLWDVDNVDRSWDDFEPEMVLEQPEISAAIFPKADFEYSFDLDNGDDLVALSLADMDLDDQLELPMVTNVVTENIQLEPAIVEPDWLDDLPMGDMSDLDFDDELIGDMSGLNLDDAPMGNISDLDFDDEPLVDMAELNLADAPMGDMSELDFDDELIGDMSGLNLDDAPMGNISDLDFDDEPLVDMAELNLANAPMGDMSELDFDDEPLVDMAELNLADAPMGDMSELDFDDELIGDISGLNLDDAPMGDMSELDFGDELIGDISGLNLDDAPMGDMSGLDLDSDLLGGISDLELNDLDVNSIAALSNDEIEGINALDNLDVGDLAPLATDDLDGLLETEDNFGGLDSLLDAAPAVVGMAAAGGITAAMMSEAASGQSMTIPAYEQTPVKAAPVPTRSSKQRTFEQTMRVSVKNLNNLNNLTGELVVNRNTLEQDQNRMRQFIDKLLLEVQKLNEVGKSMQDLYEKSLLENSLIASRQQSKSMVPGANGGDSDSEYDPLEMDKFTPVHLISQQMIELTVRIRESTSDIEFVVDSSTEVTRSLRQITSQLQEDLNKSRMLPFSQTSDRLQRGVRDNGLKYGKEVELVVEGSDTLIDKVILESLNDPLIHMVNNAIAHGIETPAERVAAGKPTEGVISIKAIHQGTQTLISIKDDGAGIDTERVKAKAIEKGIITPARSVTMTKQEVYELLFLPSFSTKDQADELAGRGVGMDVVLSSLQEIRGTVTTESKLGQGTTFTIRLPLALSITKALMASNKDVGIAFPLDGIEDSLTLKPYSILENEAGQKCFPWRDQLMPFRPLSELLAFNRPMKRVNYYGAGQEGIEETISIVVLRSAGILVALEVDRVLGEQEIVIKPLQGPAPKPLGIAGATVLGDGRIIPIADVLELVDLATGKIELRNAQSWSIGDIPEEQPSQREPMVLVVDDSITVRQLLSLTFTKAGYRVEQARDGQEAWDKLRAGLPCDIIFCDIEMPRMDGLELLSKVQADEVIRQIPMAMLTSRGSDRHRQIASQLGASGYFIKPYLEDALLEAVKRMLKGEVLAIV
jgi:chemotaxis protein histidine kinase CheA/ActR/RegA family two-component response regulator